MTQITELTNNYVLIGIGIVALILVISLAYYIGVLKGARNAEKEYEEMIFTDHK